MTNKKRGYIDITVNGKKKTLHFSMNFWAEFTEQMGISLQDIGTVFESGISLNGLRALIYSAVLANDLEQGNEVDYNIYAVGTWLDDIDAETINKIVETMVESKILGTALNNNESKIPAKPKPSKK
tara:strand:- start:10934 stop:11311 length:378 start_codon:yes stop_codon:yes gene_type:complete